MHLVNPPPFRPILVLDAPLVMPLLISLPLLRLNVLSMNSPARKSSSERSLFNLLASMNPPETREKVPRVVERPEVEVRVKEGAMVAVAAIVVAVVVVVSEVVGSSAITVM